MLRSSVLLIALGAVFAAAPGFAADAPRKPAAQGLQIRHGFGIDLTRIVIKASAYARSGGVVFSNNTEIDYIAKNRLVDFFTKTPVQSAVVSPPMMLMPQGRQTRVTVTVTDPQHLASDRESLFLLESRAVPGNARDHKKANAAMRIDFASALKVFYRPEGLNADMSDAIRDLSFKRDDHALEVKNDSPLHVTLATLRINGDVLADGLVIKPFSTERIALKKAYGEKVELFWGGVNDYGALVSQTQDL